jgi:hypothetical protein
VIKPTERMTPALDGILDGYIQLRPKQGWELALSILHDAKQPFQVRFAVIRSIRFFHNWKPEDNETNILACLREVLSHGDLADLAIADLARWKNWDLTVDVLAQYAKKTHDAPIVKRAIIRYALACPKKEAMAFLAERRKAEPDFVGEVEEGLQIDRKK